MIKIELFVNEPQLEELAEKVEESLNTLYEMQEKIIKADEKSNRVFSQVDQIKKEQEAVLLALTKQLEVDEFERDERMQAIYEHWLEKQKGAGT